MLATKTTPKAAGKVPNIRVGGDHVVDALSDLRSESRLLTLAILGYITTLDDVRGEAAAIDPLHPFKRDTDDDWGHDIENLAVRITEYLDRILAAGG